MSENQKRQAADNDTDVTEKKGRQEAPEIDGREPTVNPSDVAHYQSLCFPLGFSDAPPSEEQKTRMREDAKKFGEKTATPRDTPLNGVTELATGRTGVVRLEDRLCNGHAVFLWFNYTDNLVFLHSLCGGEMDTRLKDGWIEAHCLKCPGFQWERYRKVSRELSVEPVQRVYPAGREFEWPADMKPHALNFSPSNTRVVEWLKPYDRVIRLDGDPARPIFKLNSEDQVLLEFDQHQQIRLSHFECKSPGALAIKKPFIDYNVRKQYWQFKCKCKHGHCNTYTKEGIRAFLLRKICSAFLGNRTQWTRTSK